MGMIISVTICLTKRLKQNPRVASIFKNVVSRMVFLKQIYSAFKNYFIWLNRLHVIVIIFKSSKLCKTLL